MSVTGPRGETRRERLAGPPGRRRPSAGHVGYGQPRWLPLENPHSHDLLPLPETEE